MRGAYLCCRAVIPGMIERGAGRIVITGSGAAYLPGARRATAYAASKAAVDRYAEMLAQPARRHASPSSSSQPGPRPHRDDRGRRSPTTRRGRRPSWRRRSSASSRPGRYDALAGRYLHAEHDDIDELLSRIDEVRERRPERDPRSALDGSRLDPERRREPEQLAVMREERACRRRACGPRCRAASRRRRTARRRAGTRSTCAVSRPSTTDAAPRHAGRIRARAVERGPDELRPDGVVAARPRRAATSAARRPGRRRSAGRRLGARGTADEAVRERASSDRGASAAWASPQATGSGGERSTCARRASATSAWPSHTRPSRSIADLVERRRQAQRHLDLRAAELLRDHPQV